MVAPGQPPTAHAAWSHPTPQETAMNSSPSNVSSIFYESSKNAFSVCFDAFFSILLLTSAPGNTRFVYREILHSPDTMHFTCSKKLNCILLSHFGTSSLHIWQVDSMLNIVAVQKWTSHLRPSLASEASRCTCHAIKICASLASLGHLSEIPITCATESFVVFDRAFRSISCRTFAFLASRIVPI